MKAMKDCANKENTQPYRRYISTQGPLPATFNDFWQVVWEQNSRVLVMLTKEEEMNKVNNPSPFSLCIYLFSPFFFFFYK